jgi:hypothetical protein
MPLRGARKARRGDGPPDTTPAPPDELKSLLGQVQEQQLAVQRALATRELHRQRRETARRLVLGTIFDRLDALARLLRLNGSALDPGLIAGLGGLLNRVGQLLQPPVGWYPVLLTYAWRSDRRHNFYRLAHREAAWELVSELECALLEVGGDHYLKVCLEEERKRDGNADDDMRWSSFHDLEKLIELQGRFGNETAPASGDRRALRSEVIELLARLYQARSDADREHRAQENLRVVRLRWTCRILAAALVVAAGLIAYRVADTWPQRLLAIALVVTPAALGGTLGSVRSLRTEDLPSRSGEQPRFRWAFIAQLLVSSTFGLLILVLAALGALPGVDSAAPLLGTEGNPLLGTQDNYDNYYALIIYSFLLGLSEPNTLNITERLLTGQVA